MAQRQVTPQTTTSKSDRTSQGFLVHTLHYQAKVNYWAQRRFHPTLTAQFTLKSHGSRPLRFSGNTGGTVLPEN
jgi:hypothetical protein